MIVQTYAKSKVIKLEQLNTFLSQNKVCLPPDAEINTNCIVKLLRRDTVNAVRSTTIIVSKLSNGNALQIPTLDQSVAGRGRHN